MKKKILQYFTLLLTAAVGVTTFLLTCLSYGVFQNRVMDNLHVYAHTLSVMMDEECFQQAAWACREDMRVTLILADGTVDFDNQADPAHMENHAQRPEVAQAILNGEGKSIRQSDTLQENTFYYAVRLPDGDVLRLAEQASSLWSLFWRALPLVLIITLVLVGLCVSVANVLTMRLIEPIEQMTAHLDNVSGVARYPELEPFMQMIQSQHEEIVRGANMRVEFTANVSHELKTPLTSISGYAELIESGMAQGEQATAFAGEIRKSANRLLTLINDIIRLSQMDAPMPDLVFEPVDLCKAADTALDQLEMSARDMGVTLQRDMRPAVVRADRRMMEELIYNLCDNAIRYNVHGGSVRVVVRPIRDKAIICVQDTGIGISKENQAHVFERFYRVDKSRSKATGGTGLGLAIVKHIAAKHDAKITLQSELGRGTTICVTLARFGH